MINHPDIVTEIAHQHHAEMIAAAEEFRRAKQVRRLRKPRRKLRRPFMRSKWIRAGLDERADGSVCELRPNHVPEPAGTTDSDGQEATDTGVIALQGIPCEQASTDLVLDL